MKKQIYIEGMSCKHCVMHVTEALKELVGVKSVNVDLKKKLATIEITTDIADIDIKLAIEDAGYDVVSIETV